MIATRQESPDRLAREEAYALLRILVRRLQRAARGVSRRERVNRHRQFAREWQNMVLEGRLGALRRAVAQGLGQAPGTDRPGEGGFLQILAAANASPRTRGERFRKPVRAVEEPQSLGGPKEEGPVGRPLPAAPARSLGPLQSELFETGLLA